MNYLALLEHSYLKYQEDAIERDVFDTTRLEFIAAAIFDFTTYDAIADEYLTLWALRVSKAILERQTFEFINTDENGGIGKNENYRWFLIMVNMPFFQHKLNWGTSIRGAWFDIDFAYEKGTGKYLPVNNLLHSSELYVEDEQLLEHAFTDREDLTAFMQAVVDFAQPEMT